jgi:hypothetical protein
MDKKKIFVQFGLNCFEIEAIEAELQRWNEKPPPPNKESPDPKFIEYVWKKLGTELGWHPFTLALHYFEYLENKQKQSKNGI